MLSEAAAIGILGAGAAAGMVNTVVGSGSLITFPTLLAAGYSPVVANVSNTVGLLAGTVSGVHGYRHELVGQRPRIRRLGLCSTLGGVTGAVLLLVLPGDVFELVVPVLILVACALVAAQPRIRRWLAARQGEDGEPGVLLGAFVFCSGVYGGYFGAAQGVILMALLSIFVADSLQRLNALKNVLAGLVNGIAAVLFVLISDVAWEASGLLALGAVVGGQAGARWGRRLPPQALRALLMVVGTTVAVKLMADQVRA